MKLRHIRITIIYFLILFINYVTYGQDSNVEIVSGNTAKLILTQDNSQGQSPATWTLNSDEIGFYIVHNQSNNFPLCIQPNSASESIVIKDGGSDGDIGFGGIPVSHDFEIQRANGATYSRINAGSVSFTILLEILT